MSRWIWRILFTLALMIVLIPGMQRWQTTISASNQPTNDVNCSLLSSKNCSAGNCGNLRILQAQIDQASRITHSSRLED